eukprot:scpid24642/ scgid27349/ 
MFLHRAMPWNVLLCLVTILCRHTYQAQVQTEQTRYVQTRRVQTQLVQTRGVQTQSVQTQSVQTQNVQAQHVQAQDVLMEYTYTPAECTCGISTYTGTHGH